MECVKHLMSGKRVLISVGAAALCCLGAHKETFRGRQQRAAIIVQLVVSEIRSRVPASCPGLSDSFVVSGQPVA